MVRMRQRRLSARLGDRSRFYKAAASPAGLSSRVSVRVSSLGSSVASRQTKTKGSQRGETNRKACQGTSSSASELSHLRHRCRRSRDGLPLRSSWFLCVFFLNPQLSHTPSPSSSSSSLSSSIGQHQHPGSAFSPPRLSVAPTLFAFLILRMPDATWSSSKKNK